MHTPDCPRKIRALFWVSRAKNGINISSMLGADDRVLVFVGHTAIVREGLGEPVRGADEGCLGVNVLCKLSVWCVLDRLNDTTYLSSLLLTHCEAALI